MKKEDAIRFAGLMEEYLNIPAFVCEMIEKQLEENKYKEVVEYVIQRRNEIENKPDYMTEQEKIEIFESRENENKRLNNIINELEKYTIEQRNIAKDNLEIIGNEGKRMATRFVVYNEYLDKLKALKEGK